MTEGDCYF